MIDCAGSTNPHEADKALWEQIFGVKNSDGSMLKPGLLDAWPKPPGKPTDELRQMFEAILMQTTWWSGYKQQVTGGAKTQCQLDSDRRCIIFVVPGGPISQSEARHMASIIKNVDIKGGKQPEFVIVQGDLAKLHAFVETGMQVALHIAIQPPPCVIGGSSDTAASQLRELERCLTDDLDWKRTMQWPVTLSDASSSRCDLETHLREGLRGFVWFGTGWGWEDRQQRLAMPSLSRIAAIIAGPDCLPPKVAVICLKYGAQAAAEALHMAGVPTVMWLELAHFDNTIFNTAIFGALRALNEGRVNDIAKTLNVTNAGCLGAETVQKWTVPKLPAE